MQNCPSKTKPTKVQRCASQQNCALMSQMGQSLQIDTPAPPAQCPLYPRGLSGTPCHLFDRHHIETNLLILQSNLPAKKKSGNSICLIGLKMRGGQQGHRSLQGFIEEFQH
jgi:hypothetical protein